MQTINKNNVRDVKESDCCAVEANTPVSDGPGVSNEAIISGAEKMAEWKNHFLLLLSFAVLVLMLTLEYGFSYIPPFPVSLVIFCIIYLLAGHNILYIAFRKAIRFDFFNEFFLMSVATLGAFAIGSYSEGVAVMIFYSIGEWFQDSAVNKAKRNIKALLDVRPDEVTVIRNGLAIVMHPDQIKINEIIQVKAGEKVALDGQLHSADGTFNTSALTGESVPGTKNKGEAVYAGMINLYKVSEVKVTSLFRDSKLSRILEIVQHATARKSQTQLFISKFAKVYTPIVFAMSVCVCLVPYFFADPYIFSDWFYRSLVFLVISCPCALVVSIPLGYFGGIGLASKHGILFKGANFLDVITKVSTIIMDKTGTLTKGVFQVQKVVTKNIQEQELVNLVAAIEKQSTHPVAKAIAKYAGESFKNLKVSGIEEVSGHGLTGRANEKDVVAGNSKLMQKMSISYPIQIESIIDTTVIVAIDGKYAGYITIADEIKDDSKKAIEELHKLNIETVMLSGDKQSVVDKISKSLGIDKAIGELLPEDKIEAVQSLKKEGKQVAFVGDGVNDR
ncbi:hypothetical protein BH20BAC1_BH20BAC1_03080 [soil metagenome]